MGPTMTKLGFVVLLVASLAAACGGKATPVSTSAPAVSFSTEDGVTLEGHLFGTGGPGVVLSHMYPADQTSWYPFAEKLAESGYRALTFDFRGYGESGGPKDVVRIDKDVTAALRYLRAHGVDKVFLMGASMGGTASLKVAEAEDVAGVIAISAPMEFQGLRVDDVAKVTEPKLFLVAEGDAPATQAAEELFAKAPDPDKRLIIYQVAAGHGTDLFKKVGAGVENDILRFLSENK